MIQTLQTFTKKISTVILCTAIALTFFAIFSYPEVNAQCITTLECCSACNPPGGSHYVTWCIVNGDWQFSGSSGCSCDKGGCAHDGSGVCVTCPPSCVPSLPAKPTLSYVPNNSNLEENNVQVGWQQITNWGKGCSSNINTYQVEIQPNCTGSFINKSGSLNASILNYDIQNLGWGTTYCWRLSASNGSQTNYSDVWRFTTPKPPTLVSAGFTNQDFCGNGVSGKITSTNTTNPVSYKVIYQKESNQSYKFIDVFFVPSFGAFAHTQNDIPENLARSKAENSNSIAIRIDLRSGEYYILNSNSTWDKTNGLNEVPNNSSTATFLEAESNFSVNSNNAEAEFKIRFENSFPSGKYNIYSEVIVELPNSAGNVSDGATELNSLSAKKTGEWTIDVISPSAAINNPKFKNNGSFDVTWSASDNLVLDNVYSYIYSLDDTGQIRDNTLSQIISAPNNSLRYPEDSANGLITKSNLGNHNYNFVNNLDKNDYIFDLYAEDQGCNITKVSGVVSAPKPWFIAYLGSVSANGGFIDIKLPNFNFFTVPFTNETGLAYLSTYSSLSGTIDIPKLQQSKFNQHDVFYSNLAAKPPLSSGETSWYDYLFDKIEGKTAIQIIQTLNFSGSMSSNLGISTGDKNFFSIDRSDPVVINSNTVCDVKAIIFIKNDLIINPDFTTTNQNGCIFVVKGNIKINGGLNKTSALIESEGLSMYDKVEAMLITDGNLETTSESEKGISYKWDGIYFNGIVFAANPSFKRSLNTGGDFNQPAHVFKFDPKYRVLFEDEISNRVYSIREVIGN